MKILFVCHRLPYPPSRGGKIRPFNMIRHLSRKHSVVAASLAHTEKELSEGEPLKEWCEELIAEVLPNRVRWMQAFRALPTPTPSSVAFFWSRRLHDRIKRRLSTTDFDLIFVHCAFMAQYVADHPGGVRILDFGDLDSAKWADYARLKRFPLSMAYAMESRKLREYERGLTHRFHHCTVTSTGEEEEYLRLGVSTPYSVIPNGVDTAYFSRNGQAVQPVIVFIGRMDYFPNIDGVCYFAHSIFPLIRRKMPNAEFRIIGSNPSRKVKKLADLPGISVTGHVPDIRPHVSGAAISVVPLRIARGTQNKALESMAMGVPVVASPLAAKGVRARPGRDLMVGENPEMFAERVLELLADPQRREELSEAARKQVETAHRWPASMEILDGLLDQTTAPGAVLGSGRTPVLSK